MDRYALAREFEFTRDKDEIQRMTDIDELKSVAVGLLKLNYGLRAFIASEVRRRVPISEYLPSSQVRELD